MLPVSNSLLLTDNVPKEEMGPLEKATVKWIQKCSGGSDWCSFLPTLVSWSWKSGKSTNLEPN